MEGVRARVYACACAPGCAHAGECVLCSSMPLARSRARSCSCSRTDCAFAGCLYLSSPSFYIPVLLSRSLLLFCHLFFLSRSGLPFLARLRAGKRGIFERARARYLGCGLCCRRRCGRRRCQCGRLLGGLVEYTAQTCQHVYTDARARKHTRTSPTTVLKGENHGGCTCACACVCVRAQVCTC